MKGAYMLLQLLIVAIIVGALVYIIQILPLNGMVKQIVIVIAVVVLAIYAIKLIVPLAGLG
jgi:hypothetical protein